MFGYGLFVVAVLVMKLVPRSSLARSLHAALVEGPLRLLGRMQCHHLIFLVLLAMMAMVAGEFIFALGSVDMAVLYALDVSLYIDGMLMALAFATLARTRSAAVLLRTAAASLGARLRRRFGRRGVRSARARREGSRSANDDDPTPAWALAA